MSEICYQPGSFEVELFNAKGEQIRTQFLQINSPEQTNTFEIPTTLPAGVYFLRATGKTGNSIAITKELIVL